MLDAFAAAQASFTGAVTNEVHLEIDGENSTTGCTRVAVTIIMDMRSVQQESGRMRTGEPGKVCDDN